MVSINRQMLTACTFSTRICLQLLLIVVHCTLVFVFRYSLTDELESLRKTAIDADDEKTFWQSVSHMQDMKCFFENVTLRSWGWYFPPRQIDKTDMAARVFLVTSGLVNSAEPNPECLQCRSKTVVVEDTNHLFGWGYRCEKFRLRPKGGTGTARGRAKACYGSIEPTENTWIENSKSVGAALFLTFCWVCRMGVQQTGHAAGARAHTAVDYFSMSRKVCEVIMSHEVLSRPLGGPGVEVEVDECYLTRRKYHRGRRMHSGTVTILGLYERASDIGFHLQVHLCNAFTKQ